MFSDDTPLMEARGPYGAPVHMTLTFVLLAAVMVRFISGWERFLQDVIVFAVLGGSLYLRVVMRACAARVQGLEVFRITLNGGCGTVEHGRATAEQEMFVTAMGPVTSMWLWAVSTALLQFGPTGGLATLLQLTAFLNFFIALVTLLPVQGMDGGRLVVLMLQRMLPQYQAERVAGAIGLGLAVIWLPAMLVSFLLFGMVLLCVPSVTAHWDMLRTPAPT